MRRRAAFLLIASAGSALLLAVAAPSAPAQTVGEHIADYTVAMQLQKDGNLHTEEQIAYDFGDTPHHGIYRDLVVSESYDAHNDRHYRITNVSVQADGASTPVQFTHSGSYLHMRIGDPNVTISGVHHYTIAYDVAGRGPHVRRPPGALLGCDRESMAGGYRSGNRDSDRAGQHHAASRATPARRAARCRATRP